jgi:hypothetical protein
MQMNLKTLVKLNNIDSILKNVIRPWYTVLLNDLNTYFNGYINNLNLINVSIFIALLVTIIVIYFLVWKGFEDRLKELVNIN